MFLRRGREPGGDDEAGDKSQTHGQQTCAGEREADAGDAGRPAAKLEELTEHDAADKTTGEVAGEIRPLASPRSAEAARPTKPVVTAWAKKVPTAMITRPQRIAGRLGRSSSGSAASATPSATSSASRVSKRRTTADASGVVMIEGRKTR